MARGVKALRLYFLLLGSLGVPYFARPPAATSQEADEISYNAAINACSKGESSRRELGAAEDGLQMTKVSLGVIG